jgi:protein tyrosine phosphatase (PTP) superfamily phosphohydrolase (DUF442 family)
MKNEVLIGGITVGGQPSQAELTSGRFQDVVNIRRPEEQGNITADALAGSDVRYTAVPFTSDTITEADVDRIRDAVAASEASVLIH